MSPELELMLTLVGSAFMFNMTKQLFNNAPAMLSSELQNTIKNAYAQSRAMNSNNQSTTNDRVSPMVIPTHSSLTGMSLESFMPQSTPSNMQVDERFASRILPEMNSNSTQHNVNEEMEKLNTIRQGQYEMFHNQEIHNNNDDDNDRFSVASSSEGSSIREPKPVVYKNSSSSKGKLPRHSSTKKSRNSTTGRELVL